MRTVNNFHRFWLLIFFGQFSVASVRTAWPSSTSSSVQLLGIFPDASGASDINTASIQLQAMFKAALILSHRYNITIDGQFIGWQLVTTLGDAMDTLSDTCQLVSTSNIVGIVGPSRSRECHIIAPFSAKVDIPVVSYGATDPELSDRKTYPTFYRTVPSDYMAALGLVKLFDHFNWTSCIIIYQNDAFGLGIVRALDDVLTNKNLQVTQTIVFDLTTRAIRGDLRSLLTSSATRVVLAWVDRSYTASLLQSALDSDVLGPQFLWILTSSISLDSFSRASYEKLTGILIYEPVVASIANASLNRTLQDAAYRIWEEYDRETFPGSDKVNYYALFAFDATWLLIQALAQLCSHNSTSDLSTCVSIRQSSLCFNRSFIHNSSFFKIIDSINFLGVSGAIQFSENTTDRIHGAHYVVKNIQRSSNALNYVPVMFWSDSDSLTSFKQTNVIVWPGHSLTAPTGYASLHGKLLQIAVIEGSPFTMYKDKIDEFGKTKTEAVGYMPDLIELLRRRIEFIPNIIMLPSNESYNSLINAVANGIYDLVVADTTVTAARREKVGFSSSIFDNSLRIITRKESIPTVDYLSYLKPFSHQLWLTLLAVGIFSGFIIGILERQTNISLQNKPFVSMIGISMWYAFGTIIGFGSNFHVTTAAGRLVTVALYILSLVSIAAYTANLASDLTILKTKDVISGVDDIKNGKLSFQRIGIVSNSSIEEYYLREISGNTRNFYPLISQSKVYSKLLDNSIDAAIMDAGAAEYSTNKMYCNLTLVGTDFGRSAYAIVFPKNWLYEQELDVHIISLGETGQLDILKRNWFQTNFCSRSIKTSTAMSMELMAGLFLTFGLIILFALFWFIWLKRRELLKIIHRCNFYKRRGVYSIKTNESRPGSK